MLAVTPAVEAVLARAAELRAEGSSWQSTARHLGYVGDDLRQICIDAGTAYDRLYRKARRAVVQEGLAEAMLVYRRHVRDADPKTAARAADGLSRIALTYYRYRTRVRVVPDPKLQGLSDEAIETARFFQNVTDERMREQAHAMRDLPLVNPWTGEILAPGLPKPAEPLPYWQVPGYSGDGAVGGRIGQGPRPPKD